MRTPLAIVAFVIAIPLLGWALIFCALVGYKVYADGLIVLEQVEWPFRIRAAVAGVSGLLFLFLGIILMGPRDSIKE
jgi:hypothetical protein